MDQQKRLAIWMDYAHTRLMETDKNGTVTDLAVYAFAQGVSSPEGQDEKGTISKRQQQAEFYKQLAATAAQYQHVLLFGPADTKMTLFNYLGGNHRFGKIKIDVMPSDKLTEYQQHAYIRAFFPGY